MDYVIARILFWLGLWQSITIHTNACIHSYARTFIRAYVVHGYVYIGFSKASLRTVSTKA